MKKTMEDFIKCHFCANEITGYQNVFSKFSNQNEYFCSKDCLEHYFKPHQNFFLKDFPSLKIDFSPCINGHEEGPKIEELKLDNPWNLNIRASIFQLEQGVKIKVEVYNHFDRSVFLLVKGFFEHLASAKNYLAQFSPQGDLESENEDGNEDEEYVITPELSYELDRIRSELLADYLHSRLPNDISFESHDLYLPYLSQTLERPDYYFQFKFKHSTILHVFQKTIPGLRIEKHDKISSYVIVCFHLNFDQPDEDPVYMPLLSFPTDDESILAKYAESELVNKRSLN